LLGKVVQAGDLWSSRQVLQLWLLGNHTSPATHHLEKRPLLIAIGFSGLFLGSQNPPMAFPTFYHDAAQAIYPFCSTILNITSNHFRYKNPAMASIRLHERKMIHDITPPNDQHLNAHQGLRI
jgi:hypothetical protein